MASLCLLAVPAAHAQGLRLPGSGSGSGVFGLPGGSGASGTTGASNASRPPAPRLLDRVIAVVDQEVITAGELARREAQFVANLRRQGVELPPPQVVRQQVLDRMINDKALLQLARATGVRVDDQTLDRAVSRIAEQNGITIAALRSQLENEGVSFASFRQDIREEIILTRLREREVDSRLQISDSEVDSFLASQGETVQRIDELKIAQILIPVDEDAPREAVALAEKRMAQAQTAVRRGESFADVAKRFSSAFTQEQGASLGWRNKDRLPALFVNAVASLKTGEVSSVVRSANGLHLLQLEERRSSIRSQEVPVHRVRHILLRVDSPASEEATRRRLEEFGRRIEMGADFAALAREYSQDPGSATRGGELDLAYPGDLVPEFERAMFALEVGQMSEPVRSQFGYHLIQLLERKREPMTEQRLRTAARMALRERKLDEAIAEWTREVRANTYVEIKRDDF